jgi:hypothetical protein
MERTSEGEDSHSLIQNLVSLKAYELHHLIQLLIPQLLDDGEYFLLSDRIAPFHHQFKMRTRRRLMFT